MKRAAAIRSVRTLPGDALQGWRLEGRPGLIREIKARLLWPVFRFARMLVVEQDLDRFKPWPTPADVEIRPLADTDLAPLASIATRRTLERFRRASAAGRTCLVAWRHGRPVGYTWISERLDPALETYPVPLPAHSTYGWDLFVLPLERSRGVGSALVTARLREAHRRGFRTFRRAIAPNNPASWRTLDKTGGEGTRVVGELVYLQLFGRAFSRFSLGAPARLRDLERAAAADSRRL